MNIGDAAAHLAMFGLKTMTTNESSLFGFSQPKWMSHSVTIITGTLGTILSVAQCSLEGWSPSKRTKLMLVVNVATMAYGHWASLQESAFSAACLKEFRDFGVMSNPNCDSPCDLLGLPKDQCIVHS
ncbi:hypothetical protein J7438_09030 [Thalassotalea sp. G20_0]|uniref:hypothetical protein n=1 Tax=Thalassotalea sp. G20_0 TaxID=2821093 RepID=UPI001ADD0DDD|nr:hypothetical protein [Thalassotalea sp. G20_0]MBO9494230.1 hypothetical protein [Thalassotalea sp. G20_0]